MKNLSYNCTNNLSFCCFQTENDDFKTERGSNIIVGSSTCGTEKRTSRRIKSSSNSNQTVTKQTPDESGVLLEEDMKVEVDENDRLEDTGDAAFDDYYLDRNMLTNTDNQSDPVPGILENVKVDFSMTDDT